MTSKVCVLSLVVFTFLIWQGCNKLIPKEKKCEIPDQKCDSALLVVGNKTHDTIHFNKGEGGTNVDYYLSVLPGGTTSFKTAGTDVRFNGDCSISRFSGPIQGVQIPSMYFSVKMNRCTKKVYFIKNANDDIDLEIEDKD